MANEQLDRIRLQHRIRIDRDDDLGRRLQDAVVQGRRFAAVGLLEHFHVGAVGECF